MSILWMEVQYKVILHIEGHQHFAQSCGKKHLLLQESIPSSGRVVILMQAVAVEIPVQRSLRLRVQKMT